MTFGTVPWMTMNARIPLIEHLMATSGAEAGLHYSMIWDTDTRRHRIYDMCPVGPPRFVDAFSRCDGMPLAEVMGVADPEHLERSLDTITDVLRFQRQRIAELPSGLAMVWQDAGVRESVGTNVFVDDHYLGWIGVFSQQPLRAETLAPSLPMVISDLEAAKAPTEHASNGTDAAAIVDAQGRCLRASAQMTRWLAEPAVHADLLRLLAQERGAESSMSGRVALAGRLVQVLHLRNDRAVIMFAQHESPRLQMIRALSRRQRSIATRTAVGHTPEEIGAELGLEASLVREQLVVIYARLGITSRAELIREIEGFVS